MPLWSARKGSFPIADARASVLLSVKHPALGGALAALGDVPSVTRGARFGPAARLAAARPAGAARAAAPTRGFSRSAGAGARLFVQPGSSCSAPCGSRLQCGTGFPWCTRRVCPEAGGSFGSKARGITNNAVRGNELPSFLPHSLAIDFSAFSAPSGLVCFPPSPLRQLLAARGRVLRPYGRPMRPWEQQH